MTQFLIDICIHFGADLCSCLSIVDSTYTYTNVDFCGVFGLFSVKHCLSRIFFGWYTTMVGIIHVLFEIMHSCLLNWWSKNKKNSKKQQKYQKQQKIFTKQNKKSQNNHQILRNFLEAWCLVCCVADLFESFDCEIIEMITNKIQRNNVNH